jgi:cellulose synthase/poly-beta-1,6-N-acetylglucosamine synthase-like glycosyltransferase
MFLQIVAVWYATMRALLTWGMLRRQATTGEQPLVSVIVAARNEGKTLPRLLTALTTQLYPRYEVIVVDDRSNDGTPAVLAHWQQRDVRIRSVRITDEPQGQSPKIEALKHGVAVANGDVFLFTDADCLLLPTWIVSMVSLFAPDVAAVVGYAELYAPNNALIEHIQVFDYFAMMAMLAGATKLGRPIGASGTNIAYRRSAYEQAGGFEALPLDVISDDMSLLQRVLDHTACRVAFCDDPQAVVRSAAVPTVKQFIDQRLRWFAGGNDVLHRNWPLLTISMTLGLFNGMLLAFPIFLLRPTWRRALVQAFTLRVVADAVSYGIAARRLGPRKVLRYFPVWLPVQMLSTNLLPLLGAVRRPSWKEHRQD